MKTSFLKLIVFGIFSLFLPSLQAAPGELQVLNTKTLKVYRDLTLAFKELKSFEGLWLGPGEFRVPDVLSLSELEGVSIIGSGRGKTVVGVTSSVSLVLSVWKMTNFSVKDMTLTHFVKPGEGCSEGVLEILQSKNATIMGNELIGSGVLGLHLYQPMGEVIVENNVIKENQTEGIIFEEVEAGEKFLKFVLKNNIIKNNDGIGLACRSGCEALEEVQYFFLKNKFFTNKGGDSDNIPQKWAKALGIKLNPPKLSPSLALTYPDMVGRNGAADAPEGGYLPRAFNFDCPYDPSYVYSDTLRLFQRKLSSNFGPMAWCVYDPDTDHPFVKGTYVYEGVKGFIEASLDENKRVITGWWSQEPTRMAPKEAGLVEFYYLPETDSFKGRYKYGESGDWFDDWAVTPMEDKD